MLWPCKPAVCAGSPSGRVTAARQRAEPVRARQAGHGCCGQEHAVCAETLLTASSGFAASLSCPSKLRAESVNKRRGGAVERGGFLRSRCCRVSTATAVSGGAAARTARPCCAVPSPQAHRPVRSGSPRRAGPCGPRRSLLRSAGLAPQRSTSLPPSPVHLASQF